MPFIKVGAVSALPPGAVTEVENNGATFAVGNSNGQLFCVDGLCPHAGGPLGQGTLNGTMLVCPWHGWEFDCRSGLNDFEDIQINTFPVSIQGEDILVDLP
jgi:nitrite reductase/ring-hydroxylating ferredoxin subunit